jgi:hypothetical protein
MSVKGFGKTPVDKKGGCVLEIGLRFYWGLF